MQNIRYATSAQKSPKTSRLIRHYERRKIARAQMVPDESLSLFAWRPRPSEVTPPRVQNESYAVAKVVRSYRVSVELARIIAELANIGGASR